MQINSGLINFSRAGDIFHYRWAVKRCLKLLDFNTDLTHITIEGSQESKLAGEHVVDLAEYRQSDKGEKSVEYFQLKHSTVRADENFTLSSLKDTIIGLSERFAELTTNNQGYKSVVFSIISNRLISPIFKENIVKLGEGKLAGKQFTSTIKKYTKFNDQKLKEFCKCLKLCDSEGNYDAQKYDIHKELSRLTVSRNTFDREKLLVAKIWERVEPGKSNVLKKEHMLEAFDVTDINEFFPAPPLFEPVTNYIPREEQASIVTAIKSAVTHTIISANGGVGKSILSSNLATEFTASSIVVAYDCFGNGSYRKPSAKRHGTKHALVQVLNTLAKDGFCDQIIPARNEPDEYWIKHFLVRVNEICTTLSSEDENALLVIIFDAADNAEMAAEEFGETCFAKLLLKEDVPKNCRLIFTCRPERLTLLDPPSNIKPIELPSFSNEETLLNLQQKYPSATLKQAVEFNRLTSGNPRVQSNALVLKSRSLDELLLSFGSAPISVEDLIERQLEETIVRIRDAFPKDYRQSIDNICTGLATLPPFIPLEVLAKVANVSIGSVKSFVADLGRPLWLIDNAVQFRDEPTEKWFQDNHSASPEDVSTYVDAIKPLVVKIPYVAEALPILLLKAERFDELVELALSDNYLPSISSFDDNQIKIHRLQYAFKAALKANRLYEAVKLALRAGEEIASNERQTDILSNNLDLTTQFLSEGRIQELAHKKIFQGSWNGSELVYSASLLSSLSSSKGEATSYFRSANHWLQRHFQKRNEAKDEDRFNEKLEDIEIVELSTTQYRLNGWKACVDFLLSWQPAVTIFRITSALFERLVDAGEFDNIELMSDYGKRNSSFILAVTSELMKVGKTPPRKCLTSCLNQIIKPSSKLDKQTDYFHKTGYSLDAYLSFFEACLIQKLPIQSIRRGVNYYYDFPALHRISDDSQYDGSREALLRFLSLQAVVKNNYKLNFEDYIPNNWLEKSDSYERSRELERAKELVGKLLPWYMVRAKVLAGQQINLIDEHKHAQQLSSKVGNSSYREYDPVPYEITKVKFQNLLFNNSDCTDEINILFTNDYKEDKLKASFANNIYYLRASCRSEKLHYLSEVIEVSCTTALSNFDLEEPPESYSESFISLARAVLSIGREDAAAYFDQALTKASNFGQEAVVRWKALSAIAKRSAEDGEHNPELAHRYMRCAEMIGDSVSREKHWDRNDAIATCFKLSPMSAFAISNRWKDRKIGWHDRQIKPLAQSALDSKLVPPSSIWALSAFSWEYGLIDFFEKCLLQEPSKQKQQQILNQLIRDLRVKGTTGIEWLRVSDIATTYSLQNEELKNIKLLSRTYKAENSTSRLDQVENSKDEYNLWLNTYNHFEILTPNGFRETYKLYDSRRGLGEYERFWSGCFQKVTSRNLISFLRIISEADLLNFYDIRSAFEKIPSEWKLKQTVCNAWNNIVAYVASRFPHEFTSIYEREYLLRSFLLNSDTDNAIQSGVVKGLSNSVDIESAGALFGFAHYSASKLSITQAKNLIDFGLSRFEDFIEEDYADGGWKAGNQLPQDLTNAFVCYIYANLGSPYAQERWRAVHAVIRLYTLNCKTEINLLIDLFSSELPKVYIPTKFSFYDLHAKLYLLVAVTRCAHENSELLLDRKDVFSAIALNKKQGILFQYYAKQICINIEKQKPNSFENSVFEEIQKSCVTQRPLLRGNKYRYRTDSFWHKNNLLGALPEVRFPYDFVEYWFVPLGRVFGVSGTQVEDLAKDVLAKKWGVTFDAINIPDSRSELWKSTRESYQAFGTKSSYPQIDKYSFYISYHLMLEVASMLLDSMPVIEAEDEEDSSWSSWLSRHLILNNDRLLLSELRDPMPIERGGWIHGEYSEEWRWEIISTDFIDHLVVKSDSKTWLNVEGDWHEHKDGRVERVSFSSILVPRELSQSLLNTTVSFENHINECYLYNFCQSDYCKYSNRKFHAIELLSRDGESNDIESKDPYVGEIYTKAFRLNENVTEVIDVTYSNDQKSCILSTDNSIVLQSKYWSEDKPNDSESYISSGSPILASLDFLKLICKSMQVEIAIQVNMERSYVGLYRNRNKDDELGYIPGYSKTFILSEDGKLRDTRKSYQLR